MGTMGALANFINGRQMYCTVFTGVAQDCGASCLEPQRALYAFRKHVQHWATLGLEACASHFVVFYDDALGIGSGSEAYVAVRDALGTHAGEWIQFFLESGGVMVMEREL